MNPAPPAGFRGGYGRSGYNLYCLLLSTLLILPVLGENTPITRFLWLSDIHLDPFYGTSHAVGQASSCQETLSHPLGQLGCDSPIPLLQETLQQIGATTTANTTFVIVTGDMCRHGTDQLERPMEATRAILTTVSQLLRESLSNSGENSNISIIPSLGNNDVTPDYYLDVRDPSEMLTMAAEALDPLLETERERSTFLTGGYFARNVSASLTVLSLNTLLYSTSHIPETGDHDDNDDPLGQFAWLQQELKQACCCCCNSSISSKRRIYLVGHIPPVVRSYRHSQMWKEPYVRRYFSILQEYSEDDCIAGQFFGHLHSDEFRSINNDDNDYYATKKENTTTTTTLTNANTTHWPLWLASSVTPIYGSNPSFRWVSYNVTTGAILDYDTYYLNLFDDNDDNNETPGSSSSNLEWTKGPSFRESYQLPDLSTMSVQSLIHRLNQSLDDPQSLLWKTLVDRQHVFDRNNNDETSSCTDLSCRRAWICTLTTVTFEEYADCLLLLEGDAVTDGGSNTNVVWTRWGRGSKERWTTGVVVVVVVSSVAAMGALFIFVRLGRKYLRQRHYHQQHPIDEHGNDGIHLEAGGDKILI